MPGLTRGEVAAGLARVSLPCCAQTRGHWAGSRGTVAWILSKDQLWVLQGDSSGGFALLEWDSWGPSSWSLSFLGQ